MTYFNITEGSTKLEPLSSEHVEAIFENSCAFADLEWDGTNTMIQVMVADQIYSANLTTDNSSHIISPLKTCSRLFLWNFTQDIKTLLKYYSKSSILSLRISDLGSMYSALSGTAKRVSLVKASISSGMNPKDLKVDPWLVEWKLEMLSADELSYCQQDVVLMRGIFQSLLSSTEPGERLETVECSLSYREAKKQIKKIRALISSGVIDRSSCNSHNDLRVLIGLLPVSEHSIRTTGETLEKMKTCQEVFLL
jgi:hypothetical protein